MRSMMIAAPPDTTWPVLRDHLCQKAFPGRWRHSVIDGEGKEFFHLGGGDGYANISLSEASTIYSLGPEDYGVQTFPVESPGFFFAWYNDRDKFLALVNALGDLPLWLIDDPESPTEFLPIKDWWTRQAGGGAL